MAEELSLAEISTEVITSINTNFTDVEEAVNAKAELNGDSTQRFKVADAVELTEAINKKQLNNAVCAIETDIAELEATVATKADRTYVDSNLALKADKSYVDANLELKTDKTYVDSNLALKANTADVNAALATKADLNGSSAQVFNVADATTPTQAVNKGQLDSAVSTINAQITEINSEMDTVTADGFRFPDYASGISKSWETVYTSEEDGWLRVYLSCSDPARAYLYINGVVACSIGTSHGVYSGGTTTTPINKGDIYLGTGGTGNSFMTFYPAKGSTT